MISISELLGQSNRKFYYCEAPAAEAEIQELVCASPIELPDEYLDLLRFSNGFRPS
jgi:hypothetical protein